MTIKNSVWMGAALVLGMLVSSCVYGVAYAQTGAETANPGLGEAEALFKTGAIIPALIVGVFSLLTFASVKISWLREGKRAAWTAAGLVGLGILLPEAMAGNLPGLSTVVTAVGSALALLTGPGLSVADTSK